jgi:hypothetical protein
MEISHVKELTSQSNFRPKGNVLNNQRKLITNLYKSDGGKGTRTPDLWLAKPPL